MFGCYILLITEKSEIQTDRNEGSAGAQRVQISYLCNKCMITNTAHYFETQHAAAMAFILLDV